MKVVPIAEMYERNPKLVLDDILILLAYGESLEATKRLTMRSIAWDYTRLYEYLKSQFVANKLAFPDELPFQDQIGDYRDQLKNYTIKQYRHILFSNLETDSSLGLTTSSELDQISAIATPEVVKLQKSISKEEFDLLKLTPIEFERVIARAFERVGFDVKMTKRTRDGGFDIIAIETGFTPRKILIECKRYPKHKKIGVRLVRQLLGIKMHEPCSSVMLITTSGFTREAMDVAQNHEWELSLMDYEAAKAFVS